MDYTVKIQHSTKELTARERVKIKDTGNATALDSIVGDNDKLVIGYAYHAILAIHNEKGEDKDYTNVVVVDREGNKFYTGSDSFLKSLTEIVDEMWDATGKEDGTMEEFDIEVYRRESKNYKGKTFITCSLV